MKALFSLLLIFLLAACNRPIVELPQPKVSVDELLDQWHQDASNANFEGYFSHFSSDSSIFMGTDATERWTVAKFKPWAKPYFDRGRAWSFTSEFRKIYYNTDSTVAWFDEKLANEYYGELRGSGVVVLKPKGWKIDHYNLSIPIPNSTVDSIIPMIIGASE